MPPEARCLISFCDVTSPCELPLCWAGGTLFTLISSLHPVVINVHHRPSKEEVAPFDLD